MSKKVLVTLNDEQAERLEKRAKEEHRTLSNMLSFILSKEDRRENPQSEINFNTEE
tara:strand:+ start:595 stop:762 length:168 start_codon:yes stop_codon:yes gene_type:complete